MKSPKLNFKKCKAVHRKKISNLVWLLMISVGLVGCQVVSDTFNLINYGLGDTFTVSSKEKNVAGIQGQFQRALYYADVQGRAHIILIDGDDDLPNQVVMLDMLWHPVAGKTPVDSQAMNVTLQYYLFAGPQRQHYGKYQGAGYLYPYNNANGKKLMAKLLRSTLILQKKSPYFIDRLGKAQLQGSFKAINNRTEYEKIKRKILNLIAQQEKLKIKN